MDNLKIPLTDLTISKDHVHVWYVSLAQSESLLQRLAQTLSEEEHKRVERFHFRKDRAHFPTIHYVLTFSVSDAIFPPLFYSCTLSICLPEYSILRILRIASKRLI